MNINLHFLVYLIYFIISTVITPTPTYYRFQNNDCETRPEDCFGTFFFEKNKMNKNALLKEYSASHRNCTG